MLTWVAMRNKKPERWLDETSISITFQVDQSDSFFTATFAWEQQLKASYWLKDAAVIN